MPPVAKLRTTQVTVRTVFAIATLLIIDWFYPGTPIFQTSDSTTFKYASLGSLDSSGCHMANSDLDD